MKLLWQKEVQFACFTVELSFDHLNRELPGQIFFKPFDPWEEFRACYQHPAYFRSIMGQRSGIVQGQMLSFINYQMNEFRPS